MAAAISPAGLIMAGGTHRGAAVTVVDTHPGAVAASRHPKRVILVAVVAAILAVGTPAADTLAEGTAITTKERHVR